MGCCPDGIAFFISHLFRLEPAQVKVSLIAPVRAQKYSNDLLHSPANKKLSHSLEGVCTWLEDCPVEVHIPPPTPMPDPLSEIQCENAPSHPYGHANVDTAYWLLQLGSILWRQVPWTISDDCVMPDLGGTLSLLVMGCASSWGWYTLPALRDLCQRIQLVSNINLLEILTVSYFNVPFY